MKKVRGLIIALVCLLCLVAILVLLWRSGIFLYDRSAEYAGNRLYWKGRVYVSVAACDLTEGRGLAKTRDGTWTVHAVKEDPTHTFVVLRSFLDQYLFVAEDYTIPIGGRVTTVSWNREYIADEAFLCAIAEICTERITSYVYMTENIYALNDIQRMKPLYIAYENCPLATQFCGLLGKINGQWVITTDISRDCRNEDGSPKAYDVGLYIIPEIYHELLETYCFK